MKFDKTNNTNIHEEDLFLYKEKWVHKLFVIFKIEDKRV